MIFLPLPLLRSALIFCGFAPLLSAAAAAEIKVKVLCHSIKGSHSELSSRLAQEADGSIVEISARLEGDQIVSDELSFQQMKKICEDTFTRHQEKNTYFFRLSAELGNEEKNLIFAKDWGNTTRIPKIVVFGDSLSDTGNLYKRNVLGVPKEPYWRGRFSDGPVWAELWANALPCELDNWALGGSLTSIKSEFYENNLIASFVANKWRAYFIPSGLSQVEDYIKTPSDFARNLHVLAIGAMNYLSIAYQIHYMRRFALGERAIFDQYAEAVVADIRTMAQKIAEVGGNRFLILNLVTMDDMPEIDQRFNGARKIMAYFAQVHNEKIEKMVDELKNEMDVHLFRVSETAHGIITSPKRYGISYPKDICYGGSCLSWDRDRHPIKANRTEHIYFDWGHPTAKVHCIIAHAAYEYILTTSLLNARFKQENPARQRWESFCPHLN